MRRRMTMGALATATTVAGLAAVAALPAAAGAKACALPATHPAPTLTSPCNGATVAKGHSATFTAHDKGVTGQVYIELSKRKLNAHQKGTPPLPSTGGFYRQMNAVKGRPGRFTYQQHSGAFTGLWYLTPGTYYVQLDHVAPGVESYGPVTTIHVR